MLSDRLDRPVSAARDHVFGPENAPITLVEYGSYACPHCRAAAERVAVVLDQFGDQLRYVFRHKPLTNNELARRAAELVERAPPDLFWKAHNELMTRSASLTEDDLRAVTEELALDQLPTQESTKAAARAKSHVEADEKSAAASGVLFTPTFFINGRRYDGPWDESSLADAMLGRLGHRVRAVAVDFANWGPSGGLLLLLMTILAIGLTNTPLGAGFEAFWKQEFGFILDGAGFRLPLVTWINDGLLTIFFLVVGLEIKREFTVGNLANRRTGALPIAAAIGGMVVPALLYVLLVGQGAWSHGWGVPMATDTAFALALIVMLGRRVPVDLRIFLTAATIVDDIGAIVVVAAYYSSGVHLEFLAAGIGVIAALVMLNRAHVYRVTPYLILGVVLWACIHESGLHATLSGVLLALFIPTRPPANLKALMIQANAIVVAEAQRNAEVRKNGPTLRALRAFDAIYDRLESPADRLLRHAGARSTYLVLPLFALANAGVLISMDVWSGHLSLAIAIIVGLVLGKPLGLVAAAALAVRLGIATKPTTYSWRQLMGAGALAGIGFTMSLFIAGQAFPTAADFAAAKIAIFVASILSVLIGIAILWNANRATDSGSTTKHHKPKATPA